MNDAHAATAAEEFDAELHERVLRRDKYRCCACGMATVAGGDFAASHGLEIHHINFDHHDNSDGNLISLCPLCHGILHVGNAARRFGNVMRISYLPYLTQEECNILSWTLGVAIYRGKQCRDDPDANVIATKAVSIANALVESEFPLDYFHDDATRKAFAAARNDIALLGTLLGNIRSRDAKMYDKRAIWLGGLRIFFDPRRPELLRGATGESLIAGLSEAGTWIPGNNWAASWMSVAVQFESEKG